MARVVRPQQINIRKGDCLLLLSELADGEVGAIITDPPYGVNFQHHTKRDARGRKRLTCWPKIHNDDSLKWRPRFCEEAYRVLKPDSYLVFFFGWPRVSEFTEGAKFAGFRIVSRVMWFKPRWMGLGYHTRGAHELAIVCAKGRPTPASKAFIDVRSWRPERGLHATQKPVGLMSDLIGQFSRPGDLVLDPFMGSGSTAIAARELGRRFLGIEIDRRYFETARKRLGSVCRKCA
jgi:DNA modification methylase